MAKKRATLKNKTANKRADNPGRPPVYNPKIHPQAAKVLCRKGAMIAELALAFGVAISTIWQWKASHAEFIESFRLGAEHADDREIGFDVAYARAVMGPLRLGLWNAIGETN